MGLTILQAGVFSSPHLGGFCFWVPASKVCRRSRMGPSVLVGGAFEAVVGPGTARWCSGMGVSGRRGPGGV